MFGVPPLKVPGPEQTGLGDKQGEEAVEFECRALCTVKSRKWPLANSTYFEEREKAQDKSYLGPVILYRGLFEFSFDFLFFSCSIFSGDVVFLYHML